MTNYDFSTKTIQNISIAEYIIGEGEPIVFLHGWGANIGLLTPLAERLVTSSYQCYMLDMPGFGESAEPPSAWTIYDYANFVLAYLDHHKLEQVHLFGHSFGGRLGLILGSQHSTRINKMALSDAAGIRQQAPLSSRFRLHTYKAIRDTLQNIGLQDTAEQLRTAYNARYGSSDFNAVSGIMRETFVQVVNEDLLPLASQVAASTLLFWGDKDEDTPLWMGKKLEETIPDAGLVVYEGAGHYAYLERAAQTAKVMHTFFSHND
ncbi:MAG: alpha/beta hydrolase [Chloroflexota bacterium]